MRMRVREALATTDGSGTLSMVDNGRRLSPHAVQEAGLRSCASAVCSAIAACSDAP
jgi:hypothetical protein